uniref:Peptidase S8/S53 domain-containing protein n=1 Tax=Branchiostoma floridae TaxID=7739 RepID=C3Y9J0_BRAFL|eukprot:XP_002607236.1 hypothetical protein BRAFLDRAFT_104478 [Branchiostoma floridae]
MGTISLDTEYLYRDVPKVNFDPLHVKVKQDGVKRIRHFFLPGEKVTLKDQDTKACTMDTRGKIYTDLVGKIIKHTSVENIYAPYARCASDMKHLTDILIKDARGYVNVYFPNVEYEGGVEMEALFSDLVENVTIFLPPEWDHEIKKHQNYMYMRVMDEELKKRAQRAKSGAAIALKLFRGDSHDVVSTSLYSDVTTSPNLFFQDHAYKYLHVEETLKIIDEIKESLQGIQDDRSIEPNIVIGILDSGLCVGHQAFAGSTLGLGNFVPVHGVQGPVSPTAGDEQPMEWEADDENDPDDRYGHGTLCASIALGRPFKVRPPDDAPFLQQTGQEEPWLTGVAPFAKIVAGRVADCEGRTHPGWVANGIRWILSLDGTDKQVDIISLSLGFNTFHAGLREAIFEANRRGKIIVCAASNDGRQQQTNIAFPARFGDVICVGSHTRLGQPSAFTPTGREIDFMAPGEDVWGASSANVNAAKPFTGTSVATPFVAGIAAIVLKAAHHIGGHELRQKVSNTTVMREILRKMASMPGHHDEAMGYGNLNPYRVFRFGEDFFKKIVDDIIYT